MRPSVPTILVVGDGLAGCLIAWELYIRGCPFTVWSDGSPAASDVAAGMSNPVSFKRILPQWNAKEQQDEARARYQLIESHLETVLWRDVPIVRVFPNREYADRWAERAAGGHGVSPFIETMDDADLHESIKAPHGAGLVPDAGWVNVVALTEASRTKWQGLGRWEQRTWNMTDGCPEGFDAVVDCRGTGAVEDLAAFGLELRKNHGEVLRVKPAADWGERIVNNVTWALPLGDGTYRVGSTYRWDIHEPICLDESPAALMQGAANARAIAQEMQCIEHRAGLRPTCFDRRPILGVVSKEHPHYHACVGWGTRGVTIGPTVARWTIEALLGEREAVPDEVHPKRFPTFTEN